MHGAALARLLRLMLIGISSDPTWHDLDQLQRGPSQEGREGQYMLSADIEVNNS
jgi:hypothetical protein